MGFPNPDALAHVTGRVIAPQNPDYDQLRKGWNLSLDQYPAFILIPESVEDVIAGVNFAREARMGIAVQSTGHGVQKPADDALLILTNRLKFVQVDPNAQRVRVGAGTVWAEVVQAVAPYGLAPLLGSSPGVGVVGYTLGGGLGWLLRKYGAAADSVIGIELVTADGILRQASHSENIDLFRGILGGGGNFGVVTALEFQLYPVTSLYGGSLLYGGDKTAEALRFFRDWTEQLPDELTASLLVVKLPSIPEVPAEMRGQLQVSLRAAYIGETEAGEAWIQKWLDWNAPLVNTFAEMPFEAIGTISNDPIEPTSDYGSGETLHQLTDEGIDAIVQHMSAPASPLLVTELRHLGGAFARRDKANTVGNREANYSLYLLGLTPTSDMLIQVQEAIAAYKADLQSSISGGVFLNFMRGAEAASRTQDGYSPADYQHLRALKAQYDPQNLFRFSYQLVP